MLQHQPPVYTLGPENFLLVVLLEDAPTHNNEHPFCGDDPNCPCRDDSNLVREYITKPLDNGLLTNREAMRLFWGKQLVSAQDAPITDEEIEAIMSGDADNQEADELDQNTHDWLSEHL